MLFMPKLAAFRHQFPDVDLDLDCSDRFVGVIEEGFDVAIRIGETQDSRLMMRALGAFRLAVVGAPGYFARAGVPRKPRIFVNIAA